MSSGQALLTKRPVQIDAAGAALDGELSMPAATEGIVLFAHGRISAIVSRGGRPDLAGRWLSRVSCPVLLIVGSRDEAVLDLNRIALEALQSSEARIVLVPGATHLFEEPGALEQAALLARQWFLDRFAAARS